MEKIVLIGQATPEQIAEWKNKHGKIVGVKRNGRIAYFRELKTMDEFNAYYASQDEQKTTQAWESLSSLTFVGGCKEMLSDPQDLLHIFKQIKTFVGGEEGELVNV